MLGQCKKLKCRAGLQLHKLSQLCQHFCRVSKIYIYTFFLNIPRNHPPFGVWNSLTNQCYQKIQVFGIHNKKFDKFQGPFSTFQLFKLSQFCYHFLQRFEDTFLKYRYPPPFVVRNSLTNVFYKKKLGVWK